jgi:hypothetical protein
MTRKKYIAQWHSLFTNYVDTTLGVIAARINQDGNGEENLSNLKLLLEGHDVYDVKSDLSCGIVTDRTLDKTEKIYAEIGKFFIDITIDDERGKESLKQLAVVYEHYRKEMTKLELNVLK